MIYNSMLDLLWPSVYDTGPELTRYWLDIEYSHVACTRLLKQLLDINDHINYNAFSHITLSGLFKS